MNMKTKTKMRKGLALIISFILIIESCSVYKSTPVSLQEAVQKNTKVKLITKENEKLKFRYLVKDDNTYYGISKQGGAKVKTPIDENLVSTIRLKDKTMSTILTIAFPVVMISSLALIFQDSFEWKSN